MTEKEFNELKPGDKVRIVEERTSGMNSLGEMDKWLGKVMTVREHRGYGDIRMKEDKHENYGGWSWGRNMIACKVPSTDTSINVLVRGNKTIAKRDKKVCIAKRSPKDKADEAKGVIIAVARLYGYDVVTDEEGKVTLADKEKIVKKIKEESTEKPSGEKEYELLSWDEALKAAQKDNPFNVTGDGSGIYYITKITWEVLRKDRIIRIEDCDENSRLKYVIFQKSYDGKRVTFYIPTCCIREKGEKTMKEETAKDRVKKELAELEEKIEKLSHALAPLAAKVGTDTEAYNLLSRQLDVMRIYAEILKRRLAIWKD